MQTHTVTTYSFDELSEDAQKKALDNLRAINVDHEFWHECILEDAKETAKLLGIDIDQIYFSGFSSQGDGACFTGTYEYAKGSAQAIKSEWPQDTELQAIAESLADLQRANFYQLTASVKHRGHYSHSMCTDIDVWREDEYASDTVTDDLTELLRDYMNWIYSRLETGYWYLTEDEQVKESIVANEYEFTESGSMY